MKISYLITLYNKQDCITDVINSIAKQYGEFDKEIIIVDDGSTDNSFERAKAALEVLEGIEYRIITQKNTGPSIALNKGLPLCTGQYVYLVDGDDYILPDSTHTLINLANKYDAKLIKGRHSNNFAKDKKHYDNSETLIVDSLKAAVKFFPYGASSCLIDRDLLVKVGGCNERIRVQDYSLSLKLAKYTPFLLVNKLLAIHIDKGQERLSRSKLNENRDTAKARMLFCLENDLDEETKLIALKAQMQKCFSWLRKTQGIKSFFTKHFVRYLATKVMNNVKVSTFKNWMKESLEVFES